VYEQHAWAAGAWRDVFADLVQGQLQQLFLTLLRRIVDASGVHVEACAPPSSPGFASDKITSVSSLGFYVDYWHAFSWTASSSSYS
jgi:hypothetical protein